MRRELLAVAITVIPGVFGCTPAQADLNRAVAEASGVTLSYKQIRCNARLRGDEEKCRAAEQAGLYRWLLRRATECAARVHDVNVSPVAAAAIEAELTAMRPNIERVAERHRAILRGVIRVREGASSELVAADLQKLGVTASELDDQLDRLADVAAAQRDLQRDHPGEMENATRETRRQELLLRSLKEIIDARVKATGRSFPAEESLLWQGAIEACGIRVVDHNYKMPQLVGAFELNVQKHIRVY